MSLISVWWASRIVPGTSQCREYLLHELNCWCSEESLSWVLIICSICLSVRQLPSSPPGRFEFRAWLYLQLQSHSHCPPLVWEAAPDRHLLNWKPEILGADTRLLGLLLYSSLSWFFLLPSTPLPLQVGLDNWLFCSLKCHRNIANKRVTLTSR